MGSVDFNCAYTVVLSGLWYLSAVGSGSGRISGMFNFILNLVLRPCSWQLLSPVPTVSKQGLALFSYRVFFSKRGGIQKGVFLRNVSAPSQMVVGPFSNG